MTEAELKVSLVLLNKGRWDMKTAEEHYQEFRRQGFDHQQARELALKAESFEVKNDRQVKLTKTRTN
jgi:hypothetical protein